MSRTAREVQAAAAGLDPPPYDPDDGSVVTRHPDAATPAPPAPKLPERMPLASSPRAKLEAHRATVRHLTALVNASDATLSELERRQIGPQSVIDHFTSQQIKDHTGELDKARAAIAAAQEDARREREASRELRVDLDAARRVLATLEDYVSKYGIRDGDPSKRVLVRALIGQLVGDGVVTKKGETREVDEPSALSLARRGVVEIVEN